jgi:hypothetical protein
VWWDLAYLRGEARRGHRVGSRWTPRPGWP